MRKIPQALAVDGPLAGQLLPRPHFGSMIHRDMHEGDSSNMHPGLPAYTDHTYRVVRLAFGGRVIHVLSSRPDDLRDNTPALAAATFYLLSADALACIDDALSLELTHSDRET